MKVLDGCLSEARRADQIVVALWGVRKELGNEFYDVITAVSRETESVSQLLRELQDLFLMYPPRVSFIVCFLDVLLPSLERTLKDMSTYLNEPLPIRSRWELLNEKLVEQSGMSIAARITMFVDLLAQLARFLSRSSLYDPTALEITCSRILRLRKLQAFPLPPLNILQPPPVIERAHWAQKIFDNKPQSVTAIKHHRDSLCFGPPMVGNQPQIPTESVILFKLSFDKNKISIMCYYDQAAPQVPIILCRWLDPYFNTLYSSHGAHELTVSRKGSSLQFRRWSLRANQSKIWAALFFKTYESKTRSILFSFYSCQNWGTSKMPNLDSLCQSSQWLQRRSRTRIWLKSLQVFVFCRKYNEKNQTKPHGQFEIRFMTEHGQLLPSKQNQSAHSLHFQLQMPFKTCSKKDQKKTERVLLFLTFDFPDALQKRLNVDVCTEPESELDSGSCWIRK
ncbi:hypothetical protein BKA65DRAFT_408802 [Rhexocercosporidium sp. MPI-PUGE-AT-0058]|nr:hypothetical protein BKA65DRAFT_408802 [Rhexocercosporidium sp. MPI-PUGE-AT-0058]